MRWSPVLACVVLLAPAAAAVPPGQDWLLLTVDLPAATSGVLFSLDATLTKVPGVRVAGFGFSSPNDRTVSVTPAPGGAAVHATLAGTDVRHDVRGGATPISQGMALAASDRFVAGDRFLLLMFSTGATFATVAVQARDMAGPVPYTLAYGTGSAVVDATLDGTAAAGVGVASAGVVTHAVAVPDGIVGAFPRSGNAGAAAHAATPPGGDAEWTVTAPLLATKDAFAGPAGTWTFQWAGTATGEATAAYAPVGAAWLDFETAT